MWGRSPEPGEGDVGRILTPQPGGVVQPWFCSSSQMIVSGLSPDSLEAAPVVSSRPAWWRAPLVGGVEGVGVWEGVAGISVEGTPRVQLPSQAWEDLMHHGAMWLCTGWMGQISNVWCQNKPPGAQGRSRGICCQQQGGRGSWSCGTTQVPSQSPQHLAGKQRSEKDLVFHGV